MHIDLAVIASQWSELSVHNRTRPLRQRKLETIREEREKEEYQGGRIKE